MKKTLHKVERMPRLTKQDALRAYARMLNALDLSKLEPLLADDFRYVSQVSFVDIESKREFLSYMAAKLQAAGGSVWAEMGWLDECFPFGPCVVVTQNGRPVSFVLAQVGKGKIKRLCWCIVPPPDSVRRTG